MAELQLPNIVGQYSQGFDRGRAQYATKLAGLAIGSQGSDRASALNQLAGVDPRLSMGLQDRFAAQDQRQAQAQQAAEIDHNKKLGGAARFMASALQTNDPARIQGAWQQVAPYLAELTGKQVPANWDDSMRPAMFQAIAKTADAFPQGKPVILSNGAQLVDPASGQVVANIQLEQRDTGELAVLRAMQQDPSLLRTYQQAHPRAESSGSSLPKPPSGYRWTPDGNLAPIAGGPADPARKGAGGTVITNPDGSTTIIPAGKANTQELNNAGFYQRMVQADKDLSSLENQGYDPTNIRDKLTAGGSLNALSSADGQKYHQAAMNWVRANLRKESGAAIGAAEAEQEFRNYFPQIGDSDAVIAQKAQMRQVVEDAMRTAAGPAIGRAAQPQQQPAQASGWSIEPVQ